MKQWNRPTKPTDKKKKKRKESTPNLFGAISHGEKYANVDYIWGIISSNRFPYTQPESIEFIEPTNGEYAQTHSHSHTIHVS